MADESLRELKPCFSKLYAKTGRPSIAPEKLLRALLLQVLYSVRSERMLMEQLNYNLLFRWFVGLNMDDTIWDATVFSKNRQRLLAGDIAEAFFEAVLKQARRRDLLSDEHFTVDGTLLEAWAGQKSFRRIDDYESTCGVGRRRWLESNRKLPRLKSEARMPIAPRPTRMPCWLARAVAARLCGLSRSPAHREIATDWLYRHAPRKPMAQPNAMPHC